MFFSGFSLVGWNFNGKAGGRVENCKTWLTTFHLSSIEVERHVLSRRSPISIAAAIIYIITQLSEEKKSPQDISLATGVTEGMIRNCSKDLYPHISKINTKLVCQERGSKEFLQLLSVCIDIQTKLTLVNFQLVLEIRTILNF